MATEYPTLIVEDVKDLIESGGAPDGAKVLDYGGELYKEEEVQRLSRNVKHHPHLFVDVESMESPEGPASGREVTDRIVFSILGCASNRRDHAKQQLKAYDLVNACRKKIVGKEIAARSGIHSNGFIKYMDVFKEFQTHGLAAHNLHVFVDLSYNLNS